MRVPWNPGPPTPLIWAQGDIDDDDDDDIYISKCISVQSINIARPACHRELRLANISSYAFPTAGGWCFFFTLLQGLDHPSSLKHCREEIHQILIVVQILILLPDIIVSWANPLSYVCFILSVSTSAQPVWSRISFVIGIVSCNVSCMTIMMKITLMIIIMIAMMMMMMKIPWNPSRPTPLIWAQEPKFSYQGSFWGQAGHSEGACNHVMKMRMVRLMMWCPRATKNLRPYFSPKKLTHNISHPKLYKCIKWRWLVYDCHRVMLSPKVLMRSRLIVSHICN